MPTPVAEMAAKYGFPPEKILTPFKAREEDFLEEMAKLAPDLCITAAYGNMLPTAFLNIPRYGTLNIHPSLLPKFRGAAPVQRAVEAGVEETGVSVAYTVLACDAGPVLAQRRVAPGDDIQAPQLLEQLFSQGTELLLERIDSVMDEAAIDSATPQDETAVVHAAKVAKEEGVLDFKLPARTLHNKVRGFAGWPGTTAAFMVEGRKAEDGESNVVLKIIRTRLGPVNGDPAQPPRLVDGTMQLTCADGSVLEVLTVQPPGKKPMEASAFWNGLQGRGIRLL